MSTDQKTKPGSLQSDCSVTSDKSTYTIVYLWLGITPFEVNYEARNRRNAVKQFRRSDPDSKIIKCTVSPNDRTEPRRETDHAKH